MKFAASASTFLALISCTAAQTPGFNAITKPTKDETLNAGSTYTVVWDYNATYPGRVSIALLQGLTPTTLVVGDTVATGIESSAGSYSWPVGSDLGTDATYGLKLSLDSDPTIFQYSFPFRIAAASAGAGGGAGGSSSLPSSLPSSPSSGSSPASPTPVTPSNVSPPQSGPPSNLSGTSPPANAATAPNPDPNSNSNNTMTPNPQSTPASVPASSQTRSSSPATSSPVVIAGAGRAVGCAFAAMGGLAAAALVAL